MAILMKRSKKHTTPHEKRIKNELQNAGLTIVALSRQEGRYLPKIIHIGEHIGGAIQGHSDVGSVMLVATDKRIIYLDKKPLFVNIDEIDYITAGGITYSHFGADSIVTLHTQIRDYKIRTVNRNAADKFVKYIEERCLEHSKGPNLR